MKKAYIRLLDKTGEVQYGLNWGHRENREKNQSYLQLSSTLYKSDFFPKKGTYFLINTDDGETFMMNRAQKTEEGTAIQTPENNSILGKFIRTRLGLEDGAEITLSSIISYGRIELEVTKQDERHFFIDFSNKWRTNDIKYIYEMYLYLEYYYSEGKPLPIEKIKNDIDIPNFSNIVKHNNGKFEISDTSSIIPESLKSFIASDFLTEHYSSSNDSSRLERYSTMANQIIYFGAPGTGKSYEAKKHTSDKLHIRTIFHPDSDYASFIGCYKPVMENGKIVYKYRAQAFINAYINAWQTNEPYYLVIEEINRGNCAQIFGDIFQLLDRTDGESDYDVYPDVDLQQYIKDTFIAAKDENAEKFNNLSIPEEILSGAVMRLPKNLSIIATMNTSDQSLFPMDSAFKRRWEWKYFAIKDEGKGLKIKVGEDGPKYDWWKTIEAINKKILAATKSSDKQIGYWFAKLPEGETIIDAERFVSKVIFYLWNDVFKDYSFGENNPFTRETTFEAFFDAKGNVVNDVVKTFLDRNYPTE